MCSSDLNKPAGGWPATGGNRTGGGQPSRGRNFGGNNNNNNNNSNKHGRPLGKLNCTTLEQVGDCEQAVIGTLHILTHPRKVLFDTGAPTSFISKQFIDRFGIRCSVLERPMTVLSAGGTLLVTHIKMEQIITICGQNYYVDLFVIPMKGIAVILGMDWLSNHGAQIDCEEKTVSIRSPDKGRIVYQGDKYTHIEVELQLNSLKESKLEEIPIVKEFQDVFPKELPGMPPDREIEFTIDLIPGTSPIAQAPYKLGPKELV